MAINTVVTCDICGKQKGEVNHWWMYDPPRTYTDAFAIWPWDSKNAHSYNHACGQECVTQAVSKWMQKHINASQEQKTAEVLAAFSAAQTF